MRILVVVICLFIYLTVNVNAQNKQDVNDLLNQAVAGDAKAQTKLFLST